MLELDPHFYIALLSLAMSLAQQQRFDEALTAARNAVQLAPQSPNALSTLASMLAQAGQFAAARGVLDQLLGLQAECYVPAYFVAQVYACLGETDNAVAWLERAYENGDWWLIWLGIEPRLDALRSDPRFFNLLQRVGLATLNRVE